MNIIAGAMISISWREVLIASVQTMLEHAAWFEEGMTMRLTAF